MPRTSGGHSTVLPTSGHLMYNSWVTVRVIVGLQT